MSNIITTDELTSYLTSSGTAADAGLVTTITEAVNQYIETYTGRCFGEIKTVTDELYRWANVIWLRQTDVISITSMTLGWPNQSQSTISSSGYYLNALGRVTLFTYANGNGSRLYNDYVGVTYKYGYHSLGYSDAPSNTIPTVPEDIKGAALSIAGGMYAWAKNGNRPVSMVSVGSYRIEYQRPASNSGNAPATDAAINNGNAAWSILDAYKLRRQ